MNDDTTPRASNASSVRRRWRASPSARIARIAVPAALAVAAIVWATISVTDAADIATTPTGPETMGAAGAEPDAVHAKGAPTDKESETDGKSIAEGAAAESTHLPSAFERDAALIVQQMRAEILTMLAAPPRNGALTPGVAVLRDRTAALRSLRVPKDIAEQWTATLTEIDGWTALLESGDRADSDDERRRSLSALERLASTLSSLTIVAR